MGIANISVFRDEEWNRDDKLESNGDEKVGVSKKIGHRAKGAKGTFLSWRLPYW